MRFAARTTHPMAARGWIWVVTYPDTVDLNRAADAYAGRIGEEAGVVDAAACFQGPAFGVHVDDDGNVTDPASRFAGVMRLVPSEQGVATLAHECTHAALAMYYRQHAIDVTADRPMADEEVLCHTVGDLVGAVTVGLQARGLWPGSA